MSNGYQREIIDFLHEYGATSIEVVPGGKHQKIEFKFRGKPCYYTIAATPSDYRASANTVADLKRLLGPQVEEAERERLRLADMLPEAPDRPTYLGKMALYAQFQGRDDKMRLRFIFPRALIDQLKLSVKQPFLVEVLDGDTWHLRRVARITQTKQPATRLDSNQLILDVTDRELSKRFIAPFGVSPADFSVVGDAIVVHLHADQLTVVKVTSPELAQHKPATKLPPEPAPEAVEEPMEQRLRVILASISAAERQTGYKLIKARATPEAEPVWLWRAPDIRLF